MKAAIPDKRLLKIAELIRKDSPVCDVGTDHALLPCYLKQRGQHVVFASDKNQNPLNSARETMRAYGIYGIELILSDGLDNIPFFDNMDIIIAGMGGETIADIISRYQPSKNQRFILQPMTRHYALRTALYALGYEILSEEAVIDAKKCYTIIYAKYTGIKKEISGLFMFIGKQTDKNYITSELLKLEKMAFKNIKLKKIIEEIKEKYDC